MNKVRVLLGFMLAVTLVIPVGAVAQTDDDASGARAGSKIVRIWTDKDGLVIVEEEHPNTVDISRLGVTVSPPEDRPEALQGLQMNRPFLIVDGIDHGANFELVRVYENDGDSALFGDDGRIPLVPQVTIDGDGMRWMPNQRQVWVPPACSATGVVVGCLDRDLINALVPELLGQPSEAGSLPPGVGELGDGYLLVSTTTEGPGSIFGFAGGITIDQVATEDDEGNVLIEGNIAVNEAYGGRLRNVRAQALDIDRIASDTLRRLSDRWMDEGVILDRDAGTWSVQGTCGPQDGTRIVATKVELGGVGAGLPSALGEVFEPLEAGTPFRVISITNIDCPGQSGGPGSDILDSPGNDTLVGLVCVGVDVVHQQDTSFIDVRAVVLVQGEPRETEGFGLEALMAIDGWNGNQRQVVPLTHDQILDDLLPFDLGLLTPEERAAENDSLDLRFGDEADDTLGGAGENDELLGRSEDGDILNGGGPNSSDESPGLVSELRVVDFTGGVDAFGRKLVKRFVIRSDAGRADLTAQTRAAIGGKNINVRAKGGLDGTCPANLEDLDLEAMVADMSPAQADAFFVELE